MAYTDQDRHHLFGFPIYLSVSLYFVFETLSLLLLRSLRSNIIPGDKPPLEVVAALVCAGSAIFGVCFVCTRRNLTFPIPNSTYIYMETHPHIYAFTSGVMLNIIVFAFSYFIVLDILSTLAIALLLRASIIVISLALDQIHWRIGYLKKRPTLLDNLAAFSALLAILSGAFSRADYKEEAHTFPVLVAFLYLIAYATRLTWMNRFKQLRLLETARAREAYFSWEQIGFFASAFISIPILILRVHGQDSEPASSFSLSHSWQSFSVAALTGCMYACAGISGVALLLSPRKSATWAGLVTRLTALAAGILGSLVAYVWLDGPGPRLMDFFTVLFFLLAVVLIARADSERETGEKGSLSLGGLGSVRLVILVLFVYMFLERLANALRLVVSSPFADDINLFALLGEIVIQSTLDALPFTLGLVVIGLLFFSRRFVSEIRDAFLKSRVALGSSRAGEQATAQQEPARASLAVQRLGWIVGALGVMLAIMTWTSNSPLQRLETLKYLNGVFSSKDVRFGRALLRDPSYSNSSKQCCRLCRDLRALCTQSVFAGDSLQWYAVSSAFNAAESVLHLRRIGALREVDFQSVWSGVTNELCVAFASHLKTCQDISPSLRTYTPLLYERAQVLIRRSSDETSTVTLDPGGSDTRGTLHCSRSLKTWEQVKANGWGGLLAKDSNSIYSQRGGRSSGSRSSIGFRRGTEPGNELPPGRSLVTQAHRSLRGPKHAPS